MSANKLFAEAVAPYSAAVKARLGEIRALVLKTARDTEGVGDVLEALRWNQFSFLTPETGSGSTIRLDGRRDEPHHLALYFHCQSGLVADFRARYPKAFTFEGDRALLFDASQPLPKPELAHCIALALTHHLRKKQKNAEETRNGRTSNHHRH